MSQSQLAIVVPMLNEAEQLPDLLEHLLPLQRTPGVAVVLVDGASVDHSPQMARLAGFRVIDSPPGRARQMNAGAAATDARRLLFLHADSRLPAGFAGALGRGLERRAWGRFDVRIQGRSPWLAVVAFMMNWRSRLTGIATGDQALFMTRQAFEAVGGFPDQPLMEDIAMSSRLRRLSRPACPKLPVSTSGRRWERGGIWRTICLMWRLRLAYWLGADPHTLAARYR